MYIYQACGLHNKVVNDLKDKFDCFTNLAYASNPALRSATNIKMIIKSMPSTVTCRPNDYVMYYVIEGTCSTCKCRRINRLFTLYCTPEIPQNTKNNYHCIVFIGINDLATCYMDIQRNLLIRTL